jgi:PAS domain S-box-containing protein
MQTNSLPISFEAFIANSTQPINVIDHNMRFVFANDAYLEATNKDRDALIGAYVFDAFPDTPERLEPVLSKFKRALEGETTFLEAQPYQIEAEDGTKITRYWRTSQEPYFDTSGNVAFLIQRAEDITEQVEASQQNELVARELSHRMKNMMTIVRSIARLTARHATSVGEYSSDFVKRLDTIARTYSQLESGAWKGLTLRQLFEDELTPYNAEHAGRVTIVGPDIDLSVQATKDLALILHELATNAAKYGAFAHNEGRLNVSWRRSASSITINWHETSVDDITEPTRSGFGSQMLKMIRDIDVDRQFHRTGMHATLTFSIKTLTSQLADDIDLAVLT